MNLKLVIVSLRKNSGGAMVVDNAVCVPHIGSKIHTVWGAREVKSLCYDFNEYTGACRVEVEVDLYTKERS